MAVVISAAPTNAAATAYSNQKHGCTLSNGYLVAVEANTTTNAKFWYSTDSGSTWTDYASDIGGWVNGSIGTPWVDSGGTERIIVTWKQSGTSGTGPTGGARTTDLIYVAVGSFNAGRTTLTWGAALDTGLAAVGQFVLYPDIDAHAESTGGMAHVVASYARTTPENSTWVLRVDISSLGVASIATREASTINVGVGQWGGIGASSYGVNTYMWGSICIDSVSKRRHVAFSTGTTGVGKGIRYVTGAYSGGTVTWAAEVAVDTTRYIDLPYRWVKCMWDGTRAVIAGLVLDGTNGDAMVYETTNFTSFTTRTLVDNVTTTNGGFNRGSAAVDTLTGDIYLFGCEGAAGKFNYQKWTRSNTTLGAQVVLDTHDLLTPGGPFAYAWFSGSTIRWVYVGGTASPFSFTYDNLVLNTAPTIAFGASSLADASFPNTATPTLTVYVTDPDSSQTLTVTFEVASDAGFSSIVYTGTATAASPQTAGAVSKTTTALTKGALRYWRARVSDGTATSANTATRTFTIYDDPTVAIGASTPATTTSTGGPTLNVGWTYGQGQSLAEAFYRVQVQTNGGATTYYDTGTIAGPATSVALDAVALAIPTDTTGTALQVVVTVTAATTGTAVSATKTFDIQWGVVTVGIVSPTNGAIVATTGITAQWTFASTRGKLQGSYRIRLMIASTGSVLLDTGFVTSAATSAAVGVILVDGSTYSLEVTLKNDQGILGT